MSNSASISAAKKRRGGIPPPMGSGPGQGQGQGMSLPPGLPPNFRQLPPQVQQQLFQQLQQRAAAAAAAKSAPTPPPPQGPHSMPPAPMQTRMSTPGPGNSTINVAGPYTVNPVIHNRAMAEVDGIHIRDLPISVAGLPCLPSGAALPPNVLFKLHHDELLNMDAILNEHSNKIQMLSNRVDKGIGQGQGQGQGQGIGVGASGGSNTVSDGSNKMGERDNFSYDKLVNNTDFITKILDNILTNTNLSDIINQIEPLQKENESLRSLLNSQQTTLNELSGLVMKLVANSMSSHDNSGHDNECNYNNYDSTTPRVVESVYTPNVGEYNANDMNMTESNYVCDPVDGVCSISIDNLEEVVEMDMDKDENREQEREGEVIEEVKHDIGH
jgi:hypothetical protein